MNPDEQGVVGLLLTAFRRWDAQPDPFTITVSKKEAWILMGLLQLLHWHPDLEPQTLWFIEKVGRLIQVAICTDPELFALAEAGWDPTLDHEETRGDQPVDGHSPLPAERP